jgi:DNA-binding response OmpR family regulator
MSTLLNRHFLVVGDDTDQLTQVIDKLTAIGAHVATVSCEELTPEFVNDNNIDFIIYNHLNRDTLCEHLRSYLKKQGLAQTIPVVALVKNAEKDIQSALDYGVAEYVTPQDDVNAIINKITALNSDDEVFSPGLAIDISPIEAEISTKGIRVFVVEDDPLLRNLLSIRLDKSGFPSEFSKDGENLNQLLKRFKPDLLVLDLMLPGRSGFEILEEVKSDRALQDIPVMVFSNKDESDDRQKAQALGADRFYVKAMTDLSELMESIEEIVNTKKK